MRIWINEDIETHRNWKDNFGLTEEDEVLSQNDEIYLSAKHYPTVEVTIPNKSFQETLPEYINPVTGEELGEQTVTINLTEHLGIYYFPNRQAVLDWITNTLDTMSEPVDTPDGTTESVPPELLPDIPEIYE